MEVLAAEPNQVRLDFVVPESEIPPTSYEEVTQRILAWQEYIPDGTVWNEHTPYGDEGYLGKYYKWTRWNGDILKSIACSAFAYVISDGVFGSSAPVTLNTKVKFEDIRPGDVLTINNRKHCVIVVQVYPEYDCMRIAEGNANGVVNWNSVFTKEYIMERIDYLETRYPEGFIDGQNTTAPSATAVPITTIAPSATATPITTVAPSATDYIYANKQEVDGSYKYLYDSDNNIVDMFTIEKGTLQYKNKPIKKFKTIKWADFNRSGNIIVVQKNKNFYSINHISLKIKKLGKDAIKRKKNKGLIINISTKNGKVNVARK